MYLQAEELRHYVKLHEWKSWFFIVFTWGLIAATFAVAILFPHPLVIFIGMIFMARHQLSLAILMHDAAHWRLFNSRWLNEWVGQFFLAAPLFFSQHSYRVLHLKHHQNPLVPDDPDISLTGGFPIPRASFYRKLLRDAVGISYFKFIKYFISRSRTNQGKVKKTETGESKRTGLVFSQVLGMIIVANALIFGALWAVGHPWLYLVMWVVPTITFLQVLLRIRGIVEHAGYQPNEDQRQNARTVVNPLQTFFFAPNNVNYHIEHHVYPSIPWYNLPRVHKIMKERGALPEKNLYTSYVDIIREVTLK